MSGIDTAEPARWSIIGLSLFMAALIALPSLSIDVVMPGFAAMRASTRATMLQTGLVITLFLAGFGTGQVCLGPLSDRFGRRPILLIGLSLYVLAGLGCTLVTSPGALLSCRTVQGVGAGAATVLALVIVRDVLTGDAARVVRSYAAAAFNFVPIIGPSLGAGLLAASGWRAAYGVPAALGAVLLIWVVLYFNETRPSRDGTLARAASARQPLWDRHFVSCVVLNAASYAALMSYIAGSPLALMDGLRLSAQGYALAFAGTSAALMLGAWLSGYSARRGIAGSRLLACGLAGGTMASLALAILPVYLGLAPAVCTLLVVLSRGLVAPNAQQAALDPFPGRAGAAAAVFGFAQVLAGTLASAVVVPLYEARGPQGIAYAIAGSSAVAVMAWLSQRNVRARTGLISSASSETRRVDIP